jgi:hypothetical protein
VQRFPDHLDQAGAHSGEIDNSTIPKDAMREMRNITTNVRFNSVMTTGMPGFIPRVR